VEDRGPTKPLYPIRTLDPMLFMKERGRRKEEGGRRKEEEENEPNLVHSSPSKHTRPNAVYKGRGNIV